MMKQPIAGIKPLFNDQELAILVAHHNHSDQKPYQTTVPALSVEDRANVFDKLCIAATLPGFEHRPEAYISIQDFSTEDVKKILLLLETSTIRSQFTWLPNIEGNTSLYLAIRDSDNQHFAGHAKKMPVEIIASGKQRIEAQKLLNNFLNSPNPEPELTVAERILPRIEIIQTINKGLYVPIGHMSEDQRSALMKSMWQNDIPIDYYKSPSQGAVFKVPYDLWPKILQVQNEINIAIDKEKAEGKATPDDMNPHHPAYHVRVAGENFAEQLNSQFYKQDLTPK